VQLIISKLEGERGREYKNQRRRVATSNIKTGCRGVIENEM